MQKSSFDNVIKDIKSLKIQGAEAVAREAVKAFKILVHTSKAKTPEKFIKDVREARKRLEASRPTEPYMRNVLKAMFYNLKGENLRELKLTLFSRVQQILSEMDVNRKFIIEIGAKKISNGMIVYTHCHSSTVTAILCLAKKQGKKFIVHNTETRPMFQGRKTAKELAAVGIKVKHYVDSAARIALKHADIMLIGADAITSEGRVINKIGSELFSEIANKYDIPVYVCTSSWKFDPETIFGFTVKIEKRKGNEIWKNPPKNVEINNLAFEIIDPELITGAITELGIFEPRILVEEVKHKYKWMF